MKEIHSGCHTQKESGVQAASENLRKPYVTGAVTALLACLCCSLPFLAIALGLTTLELWNGWLIRYHQVFEAGAMVILLAGCCYIWWHNRKAPFSNFLLHVAVMLAMYAVMSFTLKEVLWPQFIGGSKHSSTHGRLKRIFSLEDVMKMRQ